MNTLARRIVIAVGSTLPLLFLGGYLATRPHQVSPKPPAIPDEVPDTQMTDSHVCVTVSLPISSIQSQLEQTVPVEFPFDENRDGVHAYGKIVRQPISLSIAESRLIANTKMSGKVQVEKRVIVDLLLGRVNENLSVGITANGEMNASLSTVVANNWSVKPTFSLAATVAKAEAGTVIGGIDVTGHVAGPVKAAVERLQVDANARIREKMNFRAPAERLWSELASVHQVAENPPTWIRITPQKATVQQPRYTADAMAVAISIDVQTQLFVQHGKPDVVRVPLPDLAIADNLEQGFTLSVPIEISLSALNEQLDNLLAERDIQVAPKTTVRLHQISLSSSGSGVLLTVDFDGTAGWLKSVCGRLYITGVPKFDPNSAELRFSDLDYTLETRSLLSKSAEWLAHSSLLKDMQDAAVINLTPELENAKAKANQQLGKLRSGLPKSINADAVVTEIQIDKLRISQNKALLWLKSEGTLSASLTN